MAELQTLNVGRLVREMLSTEVSFVTGPICECARCMATLLLGLFEDPDPSHWAYRRYTEAEEQHRETLAQQVTGYIQRVLWKDYSAPERTELWQQLEIWAKALEASLILGQGGSEPSAGTRALCVVKVAKYLAEHPALPKPLRLSVKLVELPVPGQSGLAPIITEKKILMHGMYKTDIPAAVSARVQ